MSETTKKTFCIPYIPTQVVPKMMSLACENNPIRSIAFLGGTAFSGELRTSDIQFDIKHQISDQLETGRDSGYAPSGV
jgi:hypothetical protein